MSASIVPESPFIRACLGQAGPHTPVWFMRQAGRALPEYRKVRAGWSRMEACRGPALVCELTSQPVRRYGVDAAILFSDIVVPLAAAGVDLDIVPGVGPVVARPVRDATAVAAMPGLVPGQVAFVAEAIGLLLAELKDVPPFGFSGAPVPPARSRVVGGPFSN